ncbi:uncharacterized protein PHALS_13783 [Plasmopara halstedii]|uniref:Uncharacterized protein n=1 Tax=Plasmopara halstedii TaxID=4781 RepID=A0A0P1AR13_PLAHL|nr:uncharacterized protein PHALS_13783 [Plasmopara halstedii]CEG43592.1 hypothetical protein PHALS_13783 [Plasmopara halstedii]|eukprot:XP_024579961.1 hypothetical protein PHALS_13783 [Plasmopara halstedii]
MPKGTANGNADARHQQIAKPYKEIATNLSSKIKCDPSVMDLLAPDTIELANYVVKQLKEEDPGVFVQIIDQNALHQALALNHSPVAQGANADASAEAFRAWLISGARNVHPNSQVPRNSNFALAFHQLTQVEAIGIAYEQWHHRRWYIQLEDNRLGGNPIGQFAIVFWMAGTGDQRATFSALQNVFG